MHDVSSGPSKRRSRQALPWFAGFLTVYVCILGWGWLSQQPSGYELAGYVAKAHYFVELWHAQRGYPWWLPGYLMGNSGAGMLSFAGALPPYLLASAVFGEIAGFKIAGLALIALGGLAAYAFGARLTRDSWVGFAVGCAFVLSAQVLSRLGRQEHMTIVAAFPFVPLCFLMLLRVAERGARIDSVLLGIVFSATVLCWVKIGVTIALPLGVFAVWLFATRRESRKRLLRAILWATPVIVILAVLPLLPLLREYSLMSVFELAPFYTTQLAYSAKTATSWIDRGGSLFSVLPPALSIDQGGYYLGLAGLAAAALLIVRNWRAPRAEDAKLLGPFRIFVCMALLAFWLSFGPRSVLQGHLEILSESMVLPDWVIPFHWGFLFAQGALIYWLIPQSRWRAPVFLVLYAAYLAVPAFKLVEMLPIYRDLRAPDSFWILGGAFTWSVAAGIAVVAGLRRIPAGACRKAAAFTVLAVVLWDARPYAKAFFKRGLPAALHADFDATREFLASAPEPGRVMPVSGRYFYLQIPREGGRPLSTEALNQYFLYKCVARVQTLAYQKVVDVLSLLDIAGIAYVFVDKTDPDTPPSFIEKYGRYLPTAFENDFFLIFENRTSLYPAFFADRAAAAPEGMAEAASALKLAQKKILTIAAPEGTRPLDLPHSGDVEADESAQGAFTRAEPNDIAGSTPASLTIRTRGRTGWLVAPVSFHPDWKAAAGREPLPVYRAAGAFIGVPLTGREEAVHVWLEPPWWYAGCLSASATGWCAALVLAGLAAWPRMPRRFRRYWRGAVMERMAMLHA